MKQASRNFPTLLLALVLMAPAALLAQDEKDKKETKDKTRAEQIIITRKGDKSEKLVVEVNGDKITVNGKPIESLNKNDNVSVNRVRDVWSYADGLSGFNTLRDGHYNVFKTDSNRAMLGVSTEKNDNGVRVQNVTKGSGAEKAGLKEGDVITKIDGTNLTSPDALSEVVRKHKPGDKLSITYNRDNKSQTTNAELGKFTGSSIFTTTGDSFKFDMGDLNMENIMPRTPAMPRINGYGQNFSWSGGGPKLGLSIQDTEDGKGVKVIEVDDESNAEKAGLKNDDIILEANGKVVNSADEMSKFIRDNRDKGNIQLKVERAKKTMNIEVKLPKKLKTADL
jgi:serine protease Do